MLSWSIKALLVALAISSPVRAQITVDSKHRIDNVHPGYCGWCAIETEARRLGYWQLNGLVKYRIKKGLPSGTTPDRINDELAQHKLSYHIQWHGVKDLKIVETALKAERCCIISVTDWPVKGGNHAILLTYLSSTEVQFIDSNHTDKVTVKTRAWFDEHWNGFAMYFLP